MDTISNILTEDEFNKLSYEDFIELLDRSNSNELNSYRNYNQFITYATRYRNEVKLENEEYSKKKREEEDRRRLIELETTREIALKVINLPCCKLNWQAYIDNKVLAMNFFKDFTYRETDIFTYDESLMFNGNYRYFVYLGKFEVCVISYDNFNLLFKKLN